MGWLFGSGDSEDDDGCSGGHHFDDMSSAGHYVVRLQNYYAAAGLLKERWVVQKKMTKTCQHEGCDEQRTRRKNMAYIPKDNMSKKDVEAKLAELFVEYGEEE